MEFEDGGFPDDTIVKSWLTLCKKVFKDSSEGSTVGVHCIAGLGR